MFPRIFSHLIVGMQRNMMEQMQAIPNYRSIYRNWQVALLYSLTGVSPKSLTLRDGRRLESNRFGSLNGALWTLPRFVQDGWKIGSLEPYFLVSKKFNDIEISLMCTQSNLQNIAEVFLDETYNGSFEGKTVVDIGMNMGDSSIFFALHGAKKVLGIEPVPSAYRLAVRNIEANGLTNKITPVQVAVGDDGYVKISNLWDSSAINAIADYGPVKVRNIKPNQYISVRSMSLPKIPEEHMIDEIDFLKVDCEGCEYKLFKTLTPDFLQKVSEVAIEYHSGQSPIADVLKQEGFEVALKGHGLGRVVKGRGVGLIRGVKRHSRST